MYSGLGRNSTRCSTPSVFPVKKVNRVLCGTVNECVIDYQMQSYDVTVCKMVPRPVTQTVQVCETTMIPHTKSVNVQVTKCRPVTEMVTRQTSVKHSLPRCLSRS